MVAKERRSTSWNTGCSKVKVESNDFFTLDEYQKEVEAMKNASENKNKLDRIFLAVAVERDYELRDVIKTILND
jgi:hypothetical protein